MSNELDRQCQSVAATPGGGEIPAPMEGDPSGRGPEHGVREGTGGDQPPPRDTRPDRAPRFLETALGRFAFAEGRFLTIHPFTDFSGRTIRLFLLEILRRLDLPQVVLVPVSEVERQSYFQALEAADRADWQQLTSIWETRLINANP